MKLGKVIGQIVSTRKDERLVGHKLLLVQFLEPTKDENLRLPVATVASKFPLILWRRCGETVLLFGQLGQKRYWVINAPIDYAIVELSIPLTCFTTNSQSRRGLW